MKNGKHVSRRSFLKSATTGAAGLTVIGSGIKSVFSASQARSAWSVGMQINPDIDNEKVVCCYDPNMLFDDDQARVANSFQKQNEVVDTTCVEANMDGMAVALTNNNDLNGAWGTIFRKQAAKQWNEIKVAIKVNCIENKIMPRIAIVGKVCKELIRLGISPSNITIYDACDNASGDGKYTPYLGSGLPQGVAVLNQSKSSSETTNTPVGTSQFKCANIVLESDILVNCSVNKGHTQTDKGGFTLSMKNHTGTLKLACPSLQEMIDENKSDAILGGNPPRQQLCIVDSLWASVDGPFGQASHRPSRIAMATFGPAIDILVTRKIREEVMNASHNNSAIQTILDSFGYAESDLQWTEVPPFDPSSSKRFSGKQAGSDFSVVINNGALNSFETRFSIPSNTVSHIEISDLQGKLIRTLANTFHAKKMVWDGCSGTGTRVKSGTYLIRIQGNGFTRSQPVKIL